MKRRIIRYDEMIKITDDIIEYLGSKINNESILKILNIDKDHIVKRYRNEIKLFYNNKNTRRLGSLLILVYKLRLIDKNPIIEILPNELLNIYEGMNFISSCKVIKELYLNSDASKV